jgi:hypothetical protein
MRVVLGIVGFAVGAIGGLIAWRLGWDALAWLGLLPQTHGDRGILVVDNLAGSLLTVVAFFGSLLVIPFMVGVRVCSELLDWFDGRSKRPSR